MYIYHVRLLTEADNTEINVTTKNKTPNPYLIASMSLLQKGHYVVVRCSSRQEAERWRRALETHTVEDFASQYVQPWPVPNDPALLRDTLVIDLGSCSVRAGVLASQGEF